MSKAEKLYAQMRNHPLNWRIDDVYTLARHYGLTANRPGKGGSHVTFRAPDGKKVTVPDHKPIKPVYIKQLLALITKLENKND
jgi:hypothetical protein